MQYKAARKVALFLVHKQITEETSESHSQWGPYKLPPHVNRVSGGLKEKKKNRFRYSDDNL